MKTAAGIKNSFKTHVRCYTLSELARTKRQFITYAKERSIQASAAIRWHLLSVAIGQGF
jgi:hypothetical protein